MQGDCGVQERFRLDRGCKRGTQGVQGKMGVRGCGGAAGDAGWTGAQREMWGAGRVQAGMQSGCTGVEFLTRRMGKIWGCRGECRLYREGWGNSG